MTSLNINQLLEIIEKGSNGKFTQLYSITIDNKKYSLFGISVTFELEENKKDVCPSCETKGKVLLAKNDCVKCGGKGYNKQEE